MISRRNRRPSPPTEQLRQFTITGQKGIDVSKATIDPNVMLETRNMDTDVDGGLILRKPIIFDRFIPEIPSDVTTEKSELVKAVYMYDAESVFAIRKTSNATYINVFKGDTDIPLRLVWRSWLDYTEYSRDIPKHGFVSLNYIDFTNADIVNTATSTIITNVLVDIANPYFRRSDGTYPTIISTDLMNAELYDVPTNNVLYKPRTLIISNTTDTNGSSKLDINIVTPDINVINPADKITLDPNLDLDNPYAIRDRYESSAPSPNSILAYVPTLKVNNNITQSIVQSSSKTSAVSEVSNPKYVPSRILFEPSAVARAASLQYIGSNTSNFLEYDVQFFGWDSPLNYLENRSSNAVKDRYSSISTNVSFVLNLWVKVSSKYQSPTTVKVQLTAGKPITISEHFKNIKDPGVYTTHSALVLLKQKVPMNRIYITDPNKFHEVSSFIENWDSKTFNTTYLKFSRNPNFSLDITEDVKSFWDSSNTLEMHSVKIAPNSVNPNNKADTSRQTTLTVRGYVKQGSVYSEDSANKSFSF